MSRFLLACGGTGGHLAPGIALAEALEARGHDCRLLISTKQVDSRLCRKYPHLRVEVMPGTGFSLSPVRFARFISSQARAINFAAQVIQRFRPDGVVGFGGFTTAAVALAARAARVRVALHEANRVPGRAIRLAGPLARRVYLPPGVRGGAFRQAVVRHCGVPVRREFARVPAARARTAFGLDPAGRVLLVLGGSQGARALNEWATAALPELARSGIQVVCVTGPGQGREGVQEVAGPGVRAVFLPFCDDMPALLSAADLVVSRAGAGSIAELTRLHVPAILVPFPHAADNHQVFNARFFEQQGGGFVVEQRFLAELSREVVEVMNNSWLLRQFAQNLRRMDRDDAASFMAGDLERMLAPAPAEVVQEEVATA